MELALTILVVCIIIKWIFFMKKHYVRLLDNILETRVQRDACAEENLWITNLYEEYQLLEHSDVEDIISGRLRTLYYKNDFDSILGLGEKVHVVPIYFKSMFYVLLLYFFYSASIFQPISLTHLALINITFCVSITGLAGYQSYLAAAGTRYMFDTMKKASKVLHIAPYGA